MLISFNTHAGFASMVQQFADCKPTRQGRVSYQEYTAWKRSYIFDRLRGLRLGQSFCNHFNITDNRIYYDSNAVRCEQLIVKDWVDAQN
jgi:hypothetical protein